MYGWSNEWIKENLSFDDVVVYYTEGVKYDYRRHGFKIEDKVTEEEIKNLEEWYFTPEEIERNKKMKEQMR